MEVIKMNRRLFFILPDIVSAHAMMDKLLLARVDANHIHFLARPNMPMGDLPEATISERTDLIEGWEIGMRLGALVGFIAGLISISIPAWWYTKPLPIFTTLLICTILGILCGGIWTALLATSIPNARLKPFENQIAQGKVLMIVHAPFHRIQQLQQLILDEHSEITYKGIWPTDHVIFP
jgi:hypothetical protein